MIRSFDVPIDADGVLRLPVEIMQALMLYERPQVTFVIAGRVAHLLPAPLSLDEIQGSAIPLHEMSDDFDIEIEEAMDEAYREKYGWDSDAPASESFGRGDVNDSFRQTHN